MASWTDSTPASYTPYIPTWNTELYARQIAFKQGQYDQNVQKIQQSYDTLAGMDIMNGTQKAYLQGKLNNQINQLNTMAGADWSDNNLLSQVGGMAASITSDKVVQNALSSTARARKAIADMETARKDGKSSVENEWDLSNQLNGYTNNPDLNSSFNGQYFQYRDVKKKAVEALKALNPSVTEKDIAFDAKGNLSDALVREKFKGISPQQIKSALYSYLDSGDLHQLEISGRYSYSNVDANNFTSILNRNTQSSLSVIDEKLKTLSARKDGLSDGSALSNIQAQITSLQKEKQEILSSHQKDLEDIANGGLEKAKANHYASQFFNSFSNAFSFTETSQTYESNPFAQIAMERARISQDAKQFELTYEQRERFQQQDLAIKAAELAAKEKENGGLGGVPQTVETSTLPDVSINTFSDQTRQIENQINQEEYTFVQTHGDTSNANWLNEQRALYDAGKQVSPFVANYFRIREEREKELHSNQQLLNQLNSEADRQIGTKKSDIPENAKSLSFNIGNTKYNFSPEEIISYNQRVNSVLSQVSNKSAKEDEGFSFGRFFGFGEDFKTPSEDDKIAALRQTLTPKEFTLYQLQNKNNKNVTEKEINKTLLEYNTYSSKNHIENAALIQRRNQFINQELAKRTGESQRVAYNIPTGKTEQRTDTRRVVNDLLARASDQKESFGSATIRADYDNIKSMNDDDNTTYSLVVKGQTQYGAPQYWLRLNKNKEEYQDVPLSPEDKQAIFGNKYESQGGANSFSPLQQRISTVGNGTTNFGGVKDPIKASANSYYSRNNFVNVKNFSVKGDVISQGGRYGLMLYIYDPIQAKTFVSRPYSLSNALMDESEINQVVTKMNDAAIYQILYGKSPNEQELKQIENLNKQ